MPTGSASAHTTLLAGCTGAHLSSLSQGLPVSASFFHCLAYVSVNDPVSPDLGQSCLLVPLPGSPSDSLGLHLYLCWSSLQTWAQILGHMPIRSRCECSIDSPPQQPMTPACAHRFRSKMQAAGFTISGVSHPICPVMLGDARLATYMADDMLKRGKGTMHR